ncbi:MAG TPA: beta-galactosidase, partial [Opitutales bacterium]|nr:beta-galactosidase [Opitutales bacterium]
MKHLLAIAAVVAGAGLQGFAAEIPHLQSVGNSIQLIVDGKAMLLRAGETDNSSGEPSVLASSWKDFAAMNMNAVVTPVYWDQIEPREGSFDWASVDGIIEAARENRMRVVFLWFGSWKNSMSCYAPAWVKADTARFPRAVATGGRPIEMLSAFDHRCLEADISAFTALMQHIRDIDGDAHTVIMMQVENEIGMVEMPRDHSAAADAAFAGQVPAALMSFLEAHRDSLVPTLRKAWLAGGGKSSGTWTEVFGEGAATDELFMAWHFASYTEQVAKAGKAILPLPMYTNAALIRPGYEPGQYPSAGPLPHLVDIWRAAAPSLDFIAPDIYFTNFTYWSDAYQIPGNAHMIPETLRNAQASVNALYAFGQNGTMGYSPYGINFISGQARTLLASSYDIIRQLEPLILDNFPKGRVAACIPLGPE